MTWAEAASIAGLFALLIGALFRWVIVPNLTDFIETKLAPFEEEIRVNGGGTVKAALEDMRNYLKDLNDYTHSRNHDLINQNTSIIGYLQILLMSSDLDDRAKVRLEQMIEDRRAWDPTMGDRRQGG